MKTTFYIGHFYKRRCPLLIIITALTLFSLSGFPQYPDWTYYTAGNRVSCLARDGNTIWTGTWGGLIAVDRITGVPICYNHANSGLQDNSVSAIAIDSNGNKWIGTLEQGLTKFDGISWTYYNTMNSGLPSNSVASIAIDGNGDKWIGTSGGGGLAKYNGTTWVVYNTSNSGISSNYIRAVFIDSYGIKWISTETGISKFDGTTWTIYNISNSGIPSNDVEWITEDLAGNKWVSLWNTGIAKFNGSIWTLYNQSNTGAPLGANSTITIDQNDNKWIGTEYSGLVKFDNANWTVFNKSNSSIFSNEVRFTLIDENGIKYFAMGTGGLGWCVGSENGGLQKFDGALWTKYTTSNSGFPDDIANCAAVECNGAKWFGTSQGVAKFDGNVWTTYNTSNSGLPSDYINQISIDINDNIWIGMPGDGIGMYNNSSWTFYNTTNSGLPSDYITSFVIGSNGIKWIGTGMGLARFDGTNWIVYNTSNSGLPNNFITSLATDSSNNIWIGIDGFGISKFDGTSWSVYNTSNSGLPSNAVRRIVFDHDNNLWAGTASSGIVKYNGSSWTVYNTSNSGLPNNFINAALAIDFSNNLWMGSNTFYNGGLTKFDGTNWTTFRISNSGITGIPLDIAFDASGNKWIATMEGMAEFNEGGINTVVISNVSTSNVTCNGANDGTINITASGGTGTLQYSIDNGLNWFANGGLFTGLSPNSYTILAKETNTKISTYCSNPVVITHPPAIIISNVNITNITCYNGVTGSILVTANGGTNTLSYSIDNGTTWLLNNGFFVGLTAGSYNLKVKDSLNCEVAYTDNPIILTQPSEIVISSVTSTNITILGADDGTITIDAHGGISPLQYSIDNGTTWQDNGYFTGLSAGEYFIVTKDANNCQISYPQNPVTIEQPPVCIKNPQTVDNIKIYPNPFAGFTTISFTIKNQAFVDLTIFDCIGNKVHTIINKELPEGTYNIPYDGSSLKSGVYYYKLQYNDIIKTGKMMVLR